MSVSLDVGFSKGKWVRKPPQVIYGTSLFELNFLFQKDNIYIMDNHLAAAWCWANNTNQNIQYNFLHIDAHPDMSLRHYLKNQEWINSFDLRNCTIDEYTSLKYRFEEHETFVFINNTFIHSYLVITNSNFGNMVFLQQYEQILPISEKYSITVLHEESYLADLERCKSKKSHNKGKKSPANYHSLMQLEEILQNSTNMWIFDVDIDLFFDQENGTQIFPDDYIISLFYLLKKYRNKAVVLTIALSPEHSGGWENVQHIANLISPILDLDFKIQKVTPLA